MIFPRLNIFLVLALPSLAAFIKRAAFDDLITDLKLLDSNWTKFDSDVVAIPSSSDVAQILLIRADIVNTEKSTIQSFTDIVGLTSAPVAAVQGTVLVDVLVALKNIIVTTLTDLVTKKSFIRPGLPVGSVPPPILTDLSSLYKDTKSLENGIVKVLPATLTASANSATSSIDSAFSSVLFAYNSV